VGLERRLRAYKSHLDFPDRTSLPIEPSLDVPLPFFRAGADLVADEVLPGNTVPAKLDADLC